jgi:capsid protein
MAHWKTNGFTALTGNVLHNRFCCLPDSKDIIEGRLTLPDGMTVNDLVFEWAPAGIPWWKPDEEAKGFTTVVLGGFDSPSGICHSLGRDFKDIVDERARDEEYARSKKVSFSWMSENMGATNEGT